MDEKIARIIKRLADLYQDLESCGSKYLKCCDAIADLADAIEEASNA